MASSVVNVCNAVVTLLNAGAFPMPFTAERLWVPEFPEDRIGSLLVEVVPLLYQRENVARGLSSKDIEIDIGVIKRLGQLTDPTDAAKVAEIDALMEVVESIADAFPHGAYAGFRYLKSVIKEPFYDPERMRKRIFFSIVTVSFKKPS